MEKELLSLWLPVGLVGKFDLEKVEPLSDGHHLFLSQKKVPPTWGEGHKLKSKGFYDSVIIRDFSLRGKACYLHLKRRHDLGKNIYHEWSEVAEGTRLIKEFGAILKETHTHTGTGLQPVSNF